ncbi:MAG: hypothetical protein OXE41_09700 [Gammaproteobacteria bacterium]|nr:hypothetical protein [Gammaproteobacteria bacterium]MCY4275647.1 hypothetical protein [Gammaproteobacteria bacterium]
MKNVQVDFFNKRFTTNRFGSIDDLKLQIARHMVEEVPRNEKSGKP